MFGKPVGKLGAVGGRTLIQRAIAVLRRYGQDAHIYLPGVGMLNGLQAGNYLDSALTTLATVDNPVGGVVDAIGAINATQPTTASKPILRRDAGGRYYWQFDGSNDSLSLGGPLFQMADDHCVVAGAMCSAATGTAQIVASLSRDSSTGNSVARLQFDPSGTVSAAWTPTSGAAIITAPGNLTGSVKVLTAHKVGNVKRLRVGGVTAGTDSTVQTDAGMNSAAISDYRVGLQLPFSGAIYPIIGIKGAVTDPDLLLLEKFVGQLSGVQI